jgi:hypothetical protein
MTTTRPLCTGCKLFVGRLFDPAPLEGEHITLHRSFAELSKCATDLCNLCKFIRREFYYDSPDYEAYFFTDQRLQDDSKSVHVNVFPYHREKPEDFCDVTKRLWQFFQGNSPGPSSFRSHNDYVKDRSAVLHVLGNDISLDKLLMLARKWLTSCIAEHKKCGSRTGGDSFFLPTRLLDVGSPGQPFIQLVLSEDLPKSRKNDYITLSYCWGSAKYATCTTKDNFGERLRAIPVSSLPQTLADAVEIVRALRVKYLWIDALCIVQAEDGENEDWEREFPNMGKIYQHSLCTIAASGAEHSGVGCFYRRESATWPVQNYFLTDNNRELGKDNPVILEATLPNWNITVENSALAKRGWVLQERMLASRTLFWTEDGLFWDCSELNASECQAHLLYSNRKFPLLHELIENMQSDERKRRYEQKAWVNVLEEYSQKRLTVLSDKLAAIAGLGNEISRVTGSEYEMGIWRSNMVQELAWGADFSILGTDDSVQPQAARLPEQPSWSWASMNQKLYFRPGRHGERYEEMVEVEMLHPPVLNASNNQSTQCELRVRGRIGQLRVTKTVYKIPLSYEQVYHPTRCTFKPVREESDFGAYDDMSEVALIDTLQDTLPDTGGFITCLRWIRWVDHSRRSRSSEGGDYMRVTGAMIITPVNENEQVYRRIGWAEVVPDDCFGQNDQTIILV